MIKAKVGSILMLGIEERNVEHLKAAHPMHIGAEEIGGFGDITQLIVFYGETLRDVYDQINHVVGGTLPPFEELPKKVN